MKIKFNSDNKSPLNKKIEILKMTIARVVFHENSNIIHKFF